MLVVPELEKEVELLCQSREMRKVFGSFVSYSFIKQMRHERLIFR